MRSLLVVAGLAIVCVAIYVRVQYEEPPQLLYRSGDIVRLRSGGPDMVVRHNVYKNDYVWVDWTDNLGQPHREHFILDQVLPVTPIP